MHTSQNPQSLSIPSPPATKVVHWNIGWAGLILGTFALIVVYLFVVDGRFSDSFESSPTAAVGHFCVGLLVVPIGALVGAPFWFFGWLVKRREHVSFKPFILIGMLTFMIIGFAGKQFSANQSAISEMDLQQTTERWQKERHEALSMVELFDTSLVTV